MRILNFAARCQRAPAGLVAVSLAIAAWTTPARSQQADSATVLVANVAAALASVASPTLPSLPPAAAFRRGDRAVGPSERITETVAVVDGTVDVYGTVAGDVVVVRGDIVVHDRGEVTGNAIAIGGAVRLAGGQVDGQALTFSAAEPAAPPAPPAQRLAHQVTLVGGWLAILIIIGVGVLVLASDNLAAVADALERHYGNSLVAGLAGQVAFAPLLVALIVALILSVLGILLVPFAIVAYVIIAAGLATLGFLATAVVVGRGWRPAPAGAGQRQRAATMRAMVVGNVVLLAPWMVAAALAPWPVAESIARGVALATTWVAGTAGLGATLISRAGIQRAQSGTAQHAMASPTWQTPTPVSGVVAARRPAVTPSSGTR